MLKKILFISCVLLLSNCTISGSAFLGPIFTGAKTGSIYQASLSYSTGQIMNEIKENTIFRKSKLILPKKPEILTQKKILLTSYVVDIVEISEPLEPEPLP
tara:strand:+ start:557 stop:859 length:303 start_codon:yes stop_codon:yes gene_type:complete